MSAIEYIPYTYLIGWSKLDTWYYGAEYGLKNKTANPSNLWKTYFTSSKSVKDQIEYCGNPDVVLIRKIFKTADDAIKWEQRVLRRLKVVQKQKWLNQSDTNSKRYYASRKPLSEHHKSIIANAQLKKWSDPDYHIKMREKHMGHIHSPETKKRMQSSRKKFLKRSTDIQRKKMYGCTTGKQWFHNPLKGEERLFFSGCEPIGFVIGRIKRTTQ